MTNETQTGGTMIHETDVVRVVWLRPLTASDIVTNGNARSLWGVEVNGKLTLEQFTSKRAATSWAASKGIKLSR